MTTFGSVRDGPRFAGEDLLDHRTEELERTVLELRVETVLVVLLAELHAIVEPPVAAILFPGRPGCHPCEGRSSTAGIPGGP